MILLAVVDDVASASFPRSLDLSDSVHLPHRRSYKDFMAVSMAASVFTYIRIFSLNISCSTALIVGGSSMVVGAVGLVGARTLRVRMAVLTYGPTEVDFSPTCLVIFSVVLVYATPPLEVDTSYMSPCRSSDLPMNFSLGT
jgi:hypothetical protein